MTSIFLLLIMMLGFIARSRIVVLACITLLVLSQMQVKPFLTFLSDKGIEIGLVFLLLAILSSVVLHPLDLDQIKFSLLSKKGIIAIIAGLIATKFNGSGLILLEESPQIIVGIIIGSLLGITFLGGIPVGPLMAAGIAALVLKILSIFV